MGEEIWKAIVAGAASLVGGSALWWLQQGGRRRRLRHDIHQELLLLDAMGDRFPTMERRINARVNVKLRQYEYGRERGREFTWPWLGAVAVAAAAINFAIGLQQWWALLSSGLFGAIWLVAADAILSRRFWLQEQDRAVAQVSAMHSTDDTREQASAADQHKDDL